MSRKLAVWACIFAFSYGFGCSTNSAVPDSKTGPDSKGDGSKGETPEVVKGDDPKGETDSDANPARGTGKIGEEGTAPVVAKAGSDGWHLLRIESFDIQPETQTLADEKWSLIAKTLTPTAGWTVQLREKTGTSLSKSVEYEIVGKPPATGTSAAQVVTEVETKLDVELTDKIMSILLSGHDGEAEQCEFKTIPRPEPPPSKRPTTDIGDPDADEPSLKLDADRPPVPGTGTSAPRHPPRHPPIQNVDN